MALILKGAPVAERLTLSARERTKALKARGVTPTLAVLRVGKRAEDVSYESAAERRCEKAGVRVVKFTLPSDCTQEELIGSIARINARGDIHGCLMLRPLPEGLDGRAACAALAPEKDVDGETDAALAALIRGDEGFAPCTARACMEILDFYGIEISGRRAVVIGRSLVIGKPVALMLLARSATVTVCHSKTPDLPSVCRAADILVTAAGKAGLVDARYTNPNQVIIDVGMSDGGDGNLIGDAVFAELDPLVYAITPMPGGVGAVTSSVLLTQVVEAAERQTAGKGEAV